MKVGIITMISDNYGNRLQNYALQETLKKFNVTVKTFHNPFLKDYNETKHIIKKKIKYLLWHGDKLLDVIREDNFKRFNDAYIEWSGFWLNNTKHLSKINSEYDMVFCGSDQVWNPESLNIDGRYFGTFVDCKKRASYAASIGLDYMLDERRKEWKKYLEEMEYISVREYSGMEIIREVANREVEQHADPTLLLNSIEWRRISKKPDNVDTSKKYIFTYFLGKISDEYRNFIDSVAEKYGLNVINLNDRNDKNTFVTGPSEFIYLIDNAEIVLTDSFHGTVFSVILKKKFIVFERLGLSNSMFSRIESLMTLLKIHDSNCMFSSNMNIDDFMINYDNVDKVLEDERNRSFAYIQKCLKMEE